LSLLLLPFTSSAKTIDNNYPVGEDLVAETFPGYIITTSDERIEGNVIAGSITDNEVKVKFIHENGKKESFKPSEIKGYGFQQEIEDEMGIGITKWRHFETAMADYPPKPFGSKDVFMEKEVEGMVDVYVYYVEIRNNVEEPYRYYYYIKDNFGNFKKVDEDNFASISKVLFKDYTALTTRLGKKGFEYKNLDRMARDYNYWATNQHEKTEYRVAMKQN